MSVETVVAKFALSMTAEGRCLSFLIADSATSGGESGCRAWSRRYESGA